MSGGYGIRIRILSIDAPPTAAAHTRALFYPVISSSARLTGAIRPGLNSGNRERPPALLSSLATLNSVRTQLWLDQIAFWLFKTAPNAICNNTSTYLLGEYEPGKTPDEVSTR